jgi:hypothetical protein
MTDYQISALTAKAAPAAGDLLLIVDASDMSTPPAGAAGSDKKTTVGALTTTVLGAAGRVPPSGDDTGAADVAAINEIIGNGGVCILAQAPLSGTPYFVNSPLLPASGSGLKGAQPWSSSLNDTYGPAGSGGSGGTTIYAVAGFSGAAIVDMTNATGTQYTGVTLEDFCIEGYSTSGLGCYGILVDGAWGAGFMSGVCVHRPDLDCLRFQGDATSGDVPDDWHVFRSKFSASRNGYGVWTDNLPDSWFTDCESSENDLDGWWVNWSTNLRMAGCKAENNGQAGFHMAGQGYPYAAAALTGCTTHLNNWDGFLFDDTGGGGYGNYQLANCYALQDNQVGAAYAGYRSAGSRARIMASNCFAYGAAYGAYEGGTSYGMCFTASYFQGTTAATHDDGTNTNALVNQSPVPF